MDRAETQLVSGTLNYADDPNATFRLMAWFEAFQRFSASPVLGEAYGIPLHSTSTPPMRVPTIPI